MTVCLVDKHGPIVYLRGRRDLRWCRQCGAIGTGLPEDGLSWELPYHVSEDGPPISEVTTDVEVRAAALADVRRFWAECGSRGPGLASTQIPRASHEWAKARWRTRYVCLSPYEHRARSIYLEAFVQEFRRMAIELLGAVP